MVVQYIPGKDNVVADALSRWAYSANKAYVDVSSHGSAKDDEEMEKIEEQERKEERETLIMPIRMTQKVKKLEIQADEFFVKVREKSQVGGGRAYLP